MKKLLILVFVLLLFTTQYAVADVTNDYQVIPGEEYRVLRAEILSGDGTMIHRIYDEYSGLSGRIDYKGSMSYGKITENLQYDIMLPQSFSTLVTAKKWLQANDPTKLQLLPNTIVSEEVLNEWSKAGYRPVSEYWEFSPQGLVSYDIKADYSIIPKPYVIKGLEGPTGSNIKISVNKVMVQFKQDLPYIIDDSIVIPVSTIAQKLGYKTQYTVNDKGIGIVTLEKGPRKIEISPWRNYVIVNGEKIYFEAVPRLSIHEKILIPVDLLNFMASDVQWEVDEQKIRINIIK